MTEELTVTRIAHSCHLIEIGGLRFLTDPWFSTKPAYYPGEPRALEVADLPDLDAVIITHEHYDHCDLDALSAYRDLDVPLVVPDTVTAMATDRGFTAVTTLAPWQNTKIGGATVTATPGEHAVPEITFVLQSGSHTVYFGGDTMVVPDLTRLPEQFGRFDAALLPTNGLCVRPLGGQQIVMNAQEAADLTAALAPRVVVPHHFAFHSGWLGDRLITESDDEPTRFAAAAAKAAPDTTVRLVTPGTRVRI